MVPFELVKIKLQDKTSTFKGPMDVVKRVIAKDGLLGLYAGMESTFWRYVPAAFQTPRNLMRLLLQGTFIGMVDILAAFFKSGPCSPKLRFFSCFAALSTTSRTRTLDATSYLIEQLYLRFYWWVCRNRAEHSVCRYISSLSHSHFLLQIRCALPIPHPFEFPLM